MDAGPGPDGTVFHEDEAGRTAENTAQHNSNVKPETNAMSDFYLGQIQPFGFNFAPKNWAMCNGQLLSIQQNAALFSLLGTTYGGNGTTNFALPDLRGRASLHMGQGPGLSPYAEGQASGSETVTLISSQMPAHNHIMQATTNSTAASPNNAILATASLSTDGTPVNAYGTTPNTTMAPTSVGISGGSQPHTNMQPYLVVNWCIALSGIYPSRN